MENEEYKIEVPTMSLLPDCKQLSLFGSEKVATRKTIKAGLYDLNDLSGSEWTLHGKSVQTFDGAITKKRKKHGAAYPLTLAKHFIEIYSKEDDRILDPFAGVGTTLDAANILKRNSLGIELNPEFIRLFHKGIDSLDRMKILFDALLHIAKQGTYNIWVVRDY